MLKIGWSKRDVSTTEPVIIFGQFHARISKGVADPIMLSTLVIEGDDDIAIFMSGDFVQSWKAIDEIRSEILKRRADFPVMKITFNATHTHCSPSYDLDVPFLMAPFGDREVYPSEKYRAFFINAAVESILEAYDNREEGAIAYGYGYAVVSHSRRVTYFDNVSQRPDGDSESLVSINGHARMYGNTNDEMFAGYEGGADTYVNLMYTFDKEEHLTGAIINVPCPSQNSELDEYQTADYWYEVRENLRKKYGDIGILTQCAAAGDLAPRTLHYRNAEKRRYSLKYDKPIEQVVRPQCNRVEIAERICAAFDEVLSWAKKDMIYDAKVSHTVKDIMLEQRKITDTEYRFAKQERDKFVQDGWHHTDDDEKDFYENTIIANNIARFENVIARYEKQKQTMLTPMELHVVRVGDIAFATNAYELYIDFQHRIQARSPFTQTFIVQLSSQPEGYYAEYLATERAVANKGYSATMFCNKISATGGQMLVEETVKELKNLFYEQ